MSICLQNLDLCVHGFIGFFSMDNLCIHHGVLCFIGLFPVHFIASGPKILLILLSISFASVFRQLAIDFEIGHGFCRGPSCNVQGLIQKYFVRIFGFPEIRKNLSIKRRGIVFLLQRWYWQHFGNRHSCCGVDRGLHDLFRWLESLLNVFFSLELL